jgi:hypothetical protein
VVCARARGRAPQPGGNGQPGDAPLNAQGFTPCTGGLAGTFPCNKVDLASFLPVADIDGTTAAGIKAFLDSTEYRRRFGQ